MEETCRITTMFVTETVFYFIFNLMYILIDELNQ